MFSWDEWARRAARRRRNTYKSAQAVIMREGVLDLSRWVGVVMFWRRMIAKLTATVAPGHVGLTPVCDNFIPAVS